MRPLRTGPGAQQGQCGIRGTAIDHQMLDPRVTLQPDTIEGFRNECTLIERWGHDRDGGHDGFSPVLLGSERSCGAANASAAKSHKGNESPKLIVSARPRMAVKITSAMQTAR